MEKSNYNRTLQKKLLIALVPPLLILMSVNSAFAYIDPGTGSYLFQVSIAIIIGALFFLRTMLRSTIKKIKRIFSKDTKEKE